MKRFEISERIYSKCMTNNALFHGFNEFLNSLVTSQSYRASYARDNTAAFSKPYFKIFKSFRIAATYEVILAFCMKYSEAMRRRQNNNLCGESALPDSSSKYCRTTQQHLPLV